jgi:hypothetical protein
VVAASADRRPVDPPPVVELRIFDGPIEHGKDITFNYNANLFLFASLEHARPIAQMRGQASASNTPPVLTGFPVAGMAYLDRPQEAGYFLFPDLSVRHEGRYRLKFNLFEQTKEEGDFDKVLSESKRCLGEQTESFDWRMDINSDDFTVFSAKKFPGLSESTALSRTVAEQGCKVRIRRDIRMRRRDGKGGDYNEDREYQRPRRTATPEATRDFRQRSISQESHRAPYTPSEPQRRSSGADYSQPPHQYGPSTGYAPYSRPPPTSYPPPPPSHEHSQPPSPSYPPPTPQNSAYPPPSPAYYHERTPSHSGPEPSPIRESFKYDSYSPKRESFSSDYRRPSSGNYGMRPATPMSVTDIKQEPLRPFAPEQQHSKGAITLPPLSSIMSQTVSTGPLMPAAAPPSRFAPLPPMHLGKRSFADFSPRGEPTSSLKNGTRQPESDHSRDDTRGYYPRASGHMSSVEFERD